MALFLHERPSAVSCTLDEGPPHNIDHSVEPYPIYYDPIVTISDCMHMSMQQHPDI
jgi:hypothetical protein